MVAQVDVALAARITGLGISNEIPIKFTHSIPPEHYSDLTYKVIGHSVQDLDLGIFPADDICGVLIVAWSGKCGILVSDDGTGMPSATGGNILLDGDKKEATYINLKGRLNYSGSIRIKGDSDSASIKYLLLSSSTIEFYGTRRYGRGYYPG